LHTIPLLRDLEQHFEDELLVIGVHSPKFTHEHDVSEVEDAIKRYDIRHPVINDSGRRLWDEYAIKAWPTLVLISTDGYIIGNYPGEPQADALRALIERSLPIADVEAQAVAFASTTARGDDLHASSYKYPSKIKRVPGEPPTWAMTDTGHHQVVWLDDRGTEIRRFGAGRSGFVDGTLNTGRFDGPEGLCCSGSTIYVADTRNHSIRYIDLESGRIATLVGTGERGAPLASYWTKGIDAMLASPWDIELVGDRLFFANAGTHQLGELRLSNGGVRVAAGNGREGIRNGPAHQAHLAQPSGLAYDITAQLLYFVDSETSAVRSLDLRNNWVDSLLGLGLFVFGDVEGSFDEARMQHPLGIALCRNKLYVADTYNNSIKVLDPERRDVIRLDSGQYECQDPLCILMSEPAGVACVNEHRLLVVDTNNHRVVEYDLQKQSSETWSPRSTRLTQRSIGALCD